MKPSAELREHILSLFKQFKEAVDNGSQGSPFSQEEGVLAIGTDPNEWWASYEVIMKASETQPDTSYVDCNPQAFSEGNVGWVAQQRKLRFPDGSVVPIRETSVWHKENGEWKSVQAHWSVGVPNEQILDYALPTADVE
jgi:hypothetical protein